MIYQIQIETERPPGTPETLNAAERFVLQFEIPDDATREDGNAKLRDRIEYAREIHPLEPGQRFLICNEKYEGFILAAAEG